ncbi:MAG: hypothetical protein HN356_06335 [Calditrichaeota bacterium]|jgi:hypothetical protein|nr:hypothetical protein [Calditrichota bacterium]MBT7619046.1 hypothetical protein [Calditrichota bacterium]MBT7788934.1 hypothetical protein [Calditrichota bacterium]
MNAFKKKWQQDEGSIDLIQLFAGLLIISIAAVGTFQALFYGYEQMDYQMRYRKAISVARSYAEYWQGRIHTDFDTANRRMMVGNLGDPEVHLLDERDPSTDLDDVICEVAYSQIVPHSYEALDAGGGDEGISEYYLFEVFVSWYEPNDLTRAVPHLITFQAAMVQSAM